MPREPDVVHGSVRVWACSTGRARIDVAAGAADQAGDPGLEERIEARWRELTASNPRLFDGAILAAESFNPDRGSVICRRQRYRRLAVRPAVDTGVRLLAVKGVVTRRAPRGIEALMIRRHPETHMYGGMWELGPAGGIDPKTGSDAYVVGHGDVAEQLGRELREESGLIWKDPDSELICMLTSDESSCLNLVLGVELERTRVDESARGWDADAFDWVPVERLGAFVDRVGARGVVPNSVALARFLGWM